MKKFYKGDEVCRWGFTFFPNGEKVEPYTVMKVHSVNKEERLLVLENKDGQLSDPVTDTNVVLSCSVVSRMENRLRKEATTIRLCIIAIGVLVVALLAGCYMAYLAGSEWNGIGIGGWVIAALTSCLIPTTFSKMMFHIKKRKACSTELQFFLSVNNLSPTPQGEKEMLEMLSLSDLFYSECFESIVRTSGIRAAYKE